MDSRHVVLNRRRVAAIGTSLAVVAVVAALTGAIARDDSGAKTFFLDNGPASFVPRGVATTTAWARGLTVVLPPRHLHVAAAKRRQLLARTGSRGPRRSVIARSSPRRPEVAVTMYTDRTLQIGDAVMTETGIRVFRGARAFPYRDSDFVAPTRAAGLSRTVTKTLASLSILPGG